MTVLQRQLLWVARLEGISFLFLLGIAMPLKYVWGHPEVVRVAGGVHGVLFLGFVIALGRVARDDRWPLGRVAGWFVASLIPLALFWWERDLRRGPR